MKKIVCGYCYNMKADAYEFWIRGTDGEWGLCLACPCTFSVNDYFPEDNHKEPEYIHCSILEEIGRAMELGYNFLGKIARPE